MASFSELITYIKANNDDFNKKIADSSAKAAKFGKNLAQFGVVASTAIGVTAVAGFGALLAIINNTTDEVSNLVDEANRLGGTVAGLQKLQYAAQLSGVSAQQLESGMTRLAKSVLSAKDGTSKAAEALKTLGLQAKDLVGLSIDEQYVKVAKALGQVSDKAQQNEIAFALFGKSGTEQLGFIRDGISEAMDEFDKLGGALTGEQAAAIDNYGDAVDKLKATFNAFAVQLTATAAPALTEFLKYVQQAIIDAGGLGQVGKKVGLFFIDGIILAVKGFQGLLDIIASIRDGFKEAKLNALELMQTLSNLDSNVGLGDFNASRSLEIARLRRDVNGQNSSTDYTSSLIAGLEKARNAVDNGQTSQKVEVTVSPAPEFIIQVSQSNTINTAIRTALSTVVGSEAGSTVAAGG